MKKRVTLADVAKHAQVSRATASLVVRDSPLVADETRKRVQQAMAELNYVYNRRAATLRTNESKTIALLVNDLINPFFAELTIGIEATTDREQYGLLLCHTTENLKKQNRFIEQCQQYGVDGILICPVIGSDAQTLAQLHHMHIPFVMVARYIPGVPQDVNYVGADNYGGSQHATRYLIEKGHRRIAFVGGLAGSSAYQDRFAGYRDALEEADIPININYVVPSSTSRQGGHDATQQLLQLAQPPSAAVCFNDIVAHGALTAINSAGIKVGVDFNIVGFDDISESKLYNPSLTTIAVSPDAVGRHAVNLLFDMLDNPNQDVKQIILSTELIVRQS